MDYEREERGAEIHFEGGIDWLKCMNGWEFVQIIPSNINVMLLGIGSVASVLF